MTAYVCGFAFEPDRRVWLIQKNRPEWQKGKLNGVGGKIEFNETAVAAMAREFQEEAGVAIPLQRWKQFHYEKWRNGNSVAFFCVGIWPGESPESKTDEQLVRMRWHNATFQELLTDHPLMYNLPYLIPMAYTLLYANADDLPFHSN